MATLSKLISLAAKIGLDIVIGQKRTDELFKLLNGDEAQTTGAASDPKSKVEVSEQVKRAAVDPQTEKEVREEVRRVAAEASQPLAENDVAVVVDVVTSAVVNGIKFVADGKTDPEEFEKALSGRRATFVIWLAPDTDTDTIGGNAGRYVHFNWDGPNSYRIRDYIGNRIFYPNTCRDRRNEGNLTAAVINLTALQVWQRSNGRIQCLVEYGLQFPVTEVTAWTRTLRLLTEVARLWGAPPGPGAASS